jgi:hypothetical protein
MPMRLLALTAAAMLVAGATAGSADARPPHHGWHGKHRHCTWVWRHHHKVRRCR